MEGRLRITEIFHSLQGETSSVGRPATFVRLTGCPLRCHYCDTAYAFHGGAWRQIPEILEQVRAGGNRLVVVTGGEPLAQADVLPLLTRLCDAGHEVFLETSGALSLAGVDTRVVKVLDLKSPDSGECERNLWENLPYSTPRTRLNLCCAAVPITTGPKKCSRGKHWPNAAKYSFLPAMARSPCAISPNGYSPIICRYACRFSCTN
jgi:7-carboxy-7-deazaguanine synthase